MGRTRTIVWAVCGLLGACGGGAGGGADGGGGGGDALAGDAGATGCEVQASADQVTIAVGGTIAAGEDATLCRTWTTPTTLDVSRFAGTLGPRDGHHALLIVRVPDGPDGVAPCSEPELMDAATRGELQLLGGVSYESDGQAIEFPSTPVQVGLRIPAGSQLVLAAHFLNAGEVEHETCASITLETGAPVVAALEFLTLLPAEEYDLVVPAGQTLDVDYVIPVARRVRIAAASTHMHVGGTLARLSAVIDDVAQVLHETTEFALAEPTRFDGQAVVVDVGDTFRLACSFENVGPTDQRFPDQMCVGGLYVLPCSVPGACP